MTKSGRCSLDLGPVAHLIDEAYNKKSWHGTNLRGSIRGMSATQAAFRAGKHSIAQIVVHCAYWKYTVRRRLRNEKRGSFAVKGSNWFALREPLDEAHWKQYVALLDSEQRALQAAVAELPATQIDAKPGGSKVSNLALLHGVALHDVYHAGQIQLIKGIAKAAQA